MKRAWLATVCGASGVGAMLVLVGCLAVGGAPGGSQGSGALRVEITDKPFPFEFIESAVVTIERVEVRRNGDTDDEGNDNEGDSNAGDDNDNVELPDNDDDFDNEADDHDDDGRESEDDDEDDESGNPFVVIFEGPASFNLLELQNGRTDLLANAVVDAGNYSQMRLIVSEGVVRLTDGREFRLEVPSGEQTGIKLHFDFDVTPGEQTLLLLDVDLSRAFSAIPSGHIEDVSTIEEFRFTPSVAMKLINLLDAGSISGRVTNGEGAVLAGVAVTAYEGDVEVNTTVSAEDGTYTLGALSAGEYRVEFSATGYADAEVIGIGVSAGENTAEVNAVMTP